jgi:ribosomal-protein-serine acetyltransferase
VVDKLREAIGCEKQRSRLRSATGTLGGVDVALREIGLADVEAYYALVDRNREHLNQHGNHPFERDATLEDMRAYFAEPWDDNVRFGVWANGELVGRVDLNPVNPPAWVLGYWIDGQMTGRGICTTACRQAIEHVRGLGAVELYAGITLGNDASVRVVQRLGFEHLQDVAGRSRWRLTLVDDPPPPHLL